MFDLNYLINISKPSRYLGGEVNSIKKDLSQVRLKFALAFPDVYEVGMSHLGLQIIYHILNSRPDIACERVFVPWPDMEEFLRHRGLPLTTLESARPLKEYDVIGFSLQYELNYTGVLNILDLSGIPFSARARGEEYPLIIGGGPITANPEPLADFFDAFVLGDGEEVILEICQEVIAFKEKKETKRQLLDRLSNIEGVYIPSFFQVTYHPDGSIEKITPLKKGYSQVVRRVLPDLDQGPFPSRPILPFMEIIHDRLNIEIARGCTRGCRFCQAGMIYRPRRERSPRIILQLVESGLKSTGHDEVSLLSLSSGDYSQIDQLLPLIIARYEEKKIAVSLPSLRVETLSPLLIEKIRQIRKTGFTLAPEAGTDRLRQVINKNNSEDDLISTIKAVFAAHWNLVKLYFMIGLPTETEEDLEGIVSLCRRALREASQEKRSAQINVSITTFVPKPHTPFQWEPQCALPEIYAKQKLLRQRLSGRGLNLKLTDPQLSLIEGVFARGDRRLSMVLEAAYALGCRLDGWGDHFRFDLWQKAFMETGLDLSFYTSRSRELTEILPWDHLNMRLSKHFLIEEKNKAFQLMSTADCRNNSCQGCGVCSEIDQLSNRLAPKLQETERVSPLSFKKKIPSQAIYRYRARYSKLERAKFLSHLELSRLLLRSFRRANLPLVFSQGFHPLPRVSFGPPLPLGYESDAEYLDYQLHESIHPEEARKLLNNLLPEGVRILEINEIPLKSLAIFDKILYVEYEIKFLNLQEWPKEKFAFALAEDKLFYCPRKNRTFPLRSLIKSVELIDDYTLIMIGQGNEGRFIRPEEILSFICGWPEDQQPILAIKKTKVQFKE